MFPHHQTFVLITLKLLFLVSALLSLIRSRVFRSLFSMAEGGCEKFPDHWNTEFFWTVIMEYISHGHPVDILIKRWVMIILLFFFFFFEFLFYDLIFNISISLLQDFFYLMSPENWLWNLSCPPTQTFLIHVDVPPVTDLSLGPMILPVSL